LLDIDRFKDINDCHGHLMGDRVLREFSALLRQSVRAYDVVARWGGDEFLLVLPGADLNAARQLATRIRTIVQTLRTPAGGAVRISTGAAEFDADFDFDATLQAADRRLYEAKRSGEGDWTDPDAPVREPRTGGRSDRSSAASVEEPEDRTR
jgi:diguanylate cyclase (GGDEF)-like protein